jgi:hypothetical protein
LKLAVIRGMSEWHIIGSRMEISSMVDWRGYRRRADGRARSCENADIVTRGGEPDVHPASE